MYSDNVLKIWDLIVFLRRNLCTSTSPLHVFIVLVLFLKFNRPHIVNVFNKMLVYTSETTTCAYYTVMYNAYTTTTKIILAEVKHELGDHKKKLYEIVL